MSKLLTLYKQLKKQDSNTIYLFKSGIFYIALDKDAIFLSQKLHFKLTALNDTTLKCGFPCGSLDKYLKIFEMLSIKVKIINSENNSIFSLKEYKQNEDMNELLKFIDNISIENLSIAEAYASLEKIQQYEKKIHQMIKE